MKAEDTVMDNEDFQKLAKAFPGARGIKEVIPKILERQAEISFKAGQRESLDKDELILEMRREYEQKLNLKYQAGIREVVEWFKNNYHGDWLTHYNQWQAKLKEWGINEGDTKNKP